MKINYKTNFSGYIHMLRASQLLLKDKTLSFTEFGAYICFVAQADFEKRHKKTYGVIIRDDIEIAKELNFNETTIYKHRKSLIKKGLLIEENGLTIVPNLYLFEHPYVWKLAKLKYPVEQLHYLFANPHIKIEIVQDIIAKLQEKQPQKTTNSSSLSSKSNLSSFEVEIDVDEISEAIERSQEE